MLRGPGFWMMRLSAYARRSSRVCGVGWLNGARSSRVSTAGTVTRSQVYPLRPDFTSGFSPLWLMLPTRLRTVRSDTPSCAASALPGTGSLLWNSARRSSSSWSV